MSSITRPWRGVSTSAGTSVNGGSVTGSLAMLDATVVRGGAVAGAAAGGPGHERSWSLSVAVSRRHWWQVGTPSKLGARNSTYHRVPPPTETGKLISLA